MILFIDACARGESRTRLLANALLDKLGTHETLRLYDQPLLPLDEKRLARRTDLIGQQRWDDDMFAYARQFAEADTIVIAAPYWDLSFPAILKMYLENIYVTGIVSRFDENGIPRGLCRAEKLYYVTTAGGPYDPAYSYGYLSDLAVRYFGIGETVLIKADMLDIQGVDPEKILQNAIQEIQQHGTRNPTA